MNIKFLKRSGDLFQGLVQLSSSILRWLDIGTGSPKLDFSMSSFAVNSAEERVSDGIHTISVHLYRAGYLSLSSSMTFCLFSKQSTI